MRSRLLAVVLLALMPTLLFAQEEENVDYSEMSLEDLLNVEVVTASKQAESAFDAPAVIRTISSRELSQFGGHQIIDVIERVTGITPNFNDGVWTPTEATRGGDTNADSANVHTLLLLNGRPIRESYNGSSNFTPLAVIPVEAVERIEVILGPGSVLYGTNAFEGVINIITKKGDENTFSIAGGAGSDSGTLYEVYGNYKKDDFYVSAAAAKFKEDGADFVTNSFSGTPQEEDNYFQDNLGIVANIGYKGFGAQVYFADMEGNASSFGPGYFPLMFTSKQTMIDLGYSREINAKWSIQANLTQNKNDFSFLNDTRFPDGQDFFEINRQAEDTLLEATVFGTLTDKVNILFGGTRENITGESSSGELPDYDESRWSAYFQVDYRPTPKVKIVAGGQYNKVADLSGKLVPRLGGIFNFTDSFGAKLLYGEAFRSAAKLQTDQNQNDIGAGYGPNPGLSPETVKTTDLQFFYKKSNYQVAATFFNSKEEDLIGVEANPDPNYGFWFNNLSGRKIKGYELESSTVLQQHILLQGSVVHNESESDSGVKDATAAPRDIFKLSAGYTSNFISAGVFYAHYSKFGDTIVIYPDRVINNPESEAWDTLNLNLTFHVKVGNTNLDLNLYAKNLQDKYIYIPQTESAETNTISINRAAQYFGTIKARF